MNVAQYTFQSPYPSSLQVGRLDPSSVQEEKSSSSGSTQQSAPVVNEIASEAKKFEATQVSKVTPTVSSDSLLDVYA